jgi:hypothetical protein
MVDAKPVTRMFSIRNQKCFSFGRIEESFRIMEVGLSYEF